MKDTKIGLIKKTQIRLKDFSIKDIKMKILVAYLTLNLMYLLIGSYIYFTENIISY